MTALIVSLLRLYQHTLSPDTGVFRLYHPYGCCRYNPTCSQYAIDALRAYGVFGGTLRACGRLLRCTPWHAGGLDSLLPPR